MRELKSVGVKGYVVEWEEVDADAYNNCEGDVAVVERCVNVKNVIGASLIPADELHMQHVLIVTAGGKLRVYGADHITRELYDKLYYAIVGA